MRAPSIRTRRIFTLSTAPVAVLLAGAMVWQGSNAAFSADTRNTGNSWETGSVAITDDDGGAAMFQIQNVVPMQPGNKCIAVTTTPSVASTVKFYVANLAADGLQPYIKVTVAQGTGGSFNSCTDFTADQTEGSQSLATIMADHASWDNGILPWTAPAGSTVKTYKISWVFDTTGLTPTQVDDLQGHAASINFEWELQNN
jgi:hypothetical protein